jgi:hypothetical protein
MWGSSDIPTRVVYRIVHTEPPTEADFLSRKALGNSAPRDVRLWDGISVYDRVEAAQRQADRFPHLGRFIAALRLPEDGSIRVEKTLSNRNHYTLWGDAVSMLARVENVVPVEVR